MSAQTYTKSTISLAQNGTELWKHRVALVLYALQQFSQKLMDTQVVTPLSWIIAILAVTSEVFFVDNVTLGLALSMMILIVFVLPQTISVKWKLLYQDRYGQLHVGNWNAEVTIQDGGH